MSIAKQIDACRRTGSGFPLTSSDVEVLSRLVGAAETALRFVDPDSDPPRMTNRECAAKLRAALAELE